MIMLAVGFFCRIAFSLLTPTFYAPDEQSHYNYVKYITQNHALPVQTSHTGAPANDWEYYQPPLYYLALTPIYLLSDRLFKDEFVTVRFLRAFSIMCWVIAMGFAFKLLKTFQTHSVFEKMFVVAMISLLPTYTFLSSVINNDNLLIAIGGAIFYLVLQPTSLKNSFLIGILIGLGLLTKLTAIVYIVLIVLMMLVARIRGTGDRAAIQHTLIQIVIAMIIWTPWVLRNLNVYGSITAEEVANVPQQWNSIYHAVWYTLKQMQMTFWAVSGIYNNISFFYPTIGKHVFYFAGIGLLYGVLIRREQLMIIVQENTNFIIASALTLLINVILVFRFGILYGQGQGRFLFPSLIPLALFMGMGFRMFPITDKESATVHLAGFFITYATSFLCFSVAMFVNA
jgi:hypothetical protein